MRISTSMIFDAGVGTINRQTGNLLHLQQQVSSGRRILTPSDDPVAAARALVVQNSRTVLIQYASNHDNARSSLQNEESQLSSVNDIIDRVRELAVQGGNAALSASDRRSLAIELRSRFDELMGIANSDDGTGQYIFSGFKGATKPFGGSVDELIANAANEVTYQGDDGQRKLQVASTRFINVSDVGSEVFMRTKAGNGYFTTDYARNAGGASTNTGTGVVDGGAVNDPVKWNNSMTDASWTTLGATPNQVDIRFWKAPADVSAMPGYEANATYFDVVDSNGASLFTDQASTSPDDASGPPSSFLSTNRYYSGRYINLDGSGYLTRPDMGVSVMLTGDPAGSSTNGGAQDGFSIRPSSSQSLFRTMANLIDTLEGTITTNAAGMAVLSNEIGFALINLDQANEGVLRIRASIGSRLNEIESLSNVNEDLNLQYQQTLSQLQDLDYAKTISDLTRKQTDLQAAQQSFVQISRMSLFNYL